MVTIVATVNPSTPSGTVIDNTASATSPTDAGSPHSSGTTHTTVATSAVLSVVKTGPATVTAGDTISYTITVSNAGPSDAQSVSLADVLDSHLTGATYQVGAGSPSPYSSPVGLGTIGAGGNVVVTIVATVNPSTPSGTVIDNTASATSPTDAGSPRSSSTVHTTVSANADLQTTKTVSADPVTQGSNFSYVIKVKNLGPSDNIGGFTVVDQLPLELTYVSGPAECVEGPVGTITCTNTTGLAANAPSMTYTLVVNAQDVGTPMNTATVTSNGTTDFELDKRLVHRRDDHPARRIRLGRRIRRSGLEEQH